MGAERDRMVDEAGVEEMAAFLDTSYTMLPTVPHEVRSVAPTRRAVFTYPDRLKGARSMSLTRRLATCSRAFRHTSNLEIIQLGAIRSSVSREVSSTCAQSSELRYFCS